MSEMFFGAGAVRPGVQPEIRCPERTDGVVHITAYPVFPGIELRYNDVHASWYEQDIPAADGVLAIDHCREGRMERQHESGHYFLAPGDLSVTLLSDAQGTARFPTGHYHGVTVTLDPKRAPDCLSCILQDVNVRPAMLAEKFCDRSGYFAARSSARVEHIFSELYQVPEAFRMGYFKVKILELLLFLSALELPAGRRSYSGAQVLLARKAAEYLEQNAGDCGTASELAAHFGVSPAQLSASFRGVYGMTPAAFLRAQKMHGAAALLRTTDRTVLDIAGQFGYDNASKFAKAFRSVIGVAPNAYRSGVLCDSCAPEALHS